MGEDHVETGDPQVEVTQEHVASEKQDDGHGDVGDEVGVTSIGDEIVVSPDKVDTLSAEPESGDLSVVAPDVVDEEKGDETSINDDNVVLPDKVDDSTAEPQSGDLSSVEETVTAAPDDGHAVDEEKRDEASINNEKDKVDESSAEQDLSIVSKTETVAPDDRYVVDEEKGDEASISNENVVLPDKVDDSSAEPQSGDLRIEETKSAAPDDGHVVDEERGDVASINNENAALPDKVDDPSAEPEDGDLSIVEETKTDVPVNGLVDSVNVVAKESEAVDTDGLSESAVPKEDGSEPGTEEKEEETKAAEIQKSELDQTDDKVGELVEKQDGAASIDEPAEDKSLENTELPTEENTAAAEFITQDDASTEAVTSQEDEINVENESAACTENEGSDQTAVDKVDEQEQVVSQEDKAVEEVAPGEEEKIENASPEKPEDPAVPVVEKNEETAEPAIVEGSEEVAEPVVVEENEELAEPSTVKPAEPVVGDAESDAVVDEAATETSQDSGEEKQEKIKSEELVTDKVDEHEQVQDREVGEDNVKASDTTADEDSSDAAAVASQEEESAGDADNTNACTGGEEGSKDIKNEHSLPLDEAAGKLEEQVQVDEKELLVTDGTVEEESVAKRSLEAFPPENSEDEVAISTGGDNTVEEEATSGIVDVEDSLKEEENTSIMVSEGDAGGADDSDDGGFVGTTHKSIGESLLLTDEEEVGPGKELTMEDAATKENAVDFPTQESTPGNDEEKPAADLPENIRQDFVATSTENLEENTTGDRELVDFEGAQIQEEASGDVVQLSEEKVADVEENEAASAENVNEDEQDEAHEEVLSLQFECDKEATDASEQGADPGLDTVADVQINESLEKNGDEAFGQQTVVDKGIGGTVSAAEEKPDKSDEDVEDETIEEGEAVKVEEEEGKGAEVEEGTGDQKASEVDHKEFDEETAEKEGKVDAEVLEEPENVVQVELERDGGAELEKETAEEAGEVHADVEEATGEAEVEEEDAVKVSADEETGVDKEKDDGGEILNANESDGVAELGIQRDATPEECNMAPETGSEHEVETVTGAELSAAPGFFIATPEKGSEQSESEKVDEVLQEAAHLAERPVPVSTEREIHEDIVPGSDQEPAPVVAKCEEKSAEKEGEVEEETTEKAGGVHADVEEGTEDGGKASAGLEVDEGSSEKENTVDRDIGEADTVAGENDGGSDDKTADGGAEVGTEVFETEACKENGIGNEVEASVGVDGLGNSGIQTAKKISFEEAPFTAQHQLSSAHAEGNKDGGLVGRESSPVAVSGDLEKSNTMDSRGIVASAFGSIVTAAMNLAKTAKPSKKKRLKLKKELAKQLQPV